MKSYMQVIYIDSDDQARHTNLRAAMDTNAATWAAFNSYRTAAVDIKRAVFLLDYYNAKGYLADTIALDAAGFRAITNEPVRTDAEYRKIDDDYWEAAMKENETRREASHG